MLREIFAKDIFLFGHSLAMYSATAISKMAAKKFKKSFFFGHAKCKTDLKNCSLKDFDFFLLFFTLISNEY